MTYSSDHRPLCLGFHAVSVKAPNHLAQSSFESSTGLVGTVWAMQGSWCSVQTDWQISPGVGLPC